MWHFYNAIMTIFTIKTTENYLLYTDYSFKCKYLDYWKSNLKVNMLLGKIAFIGISNAKIGEK